MAKAKKGDNLSCEVCGLVLVVDETCGCGEMDILCCEKPMASGKMAANRARKVAAVNKSETKAIKAPTKTPAKAATKAKPAKVAAKMPAKAAAKGAPAAKKPVRVKK
jgi:hypothetical protein